MTIVVSACLLGINCRYDAGGGDYPEIIKLMEQHTLIPVCPEQLGGMQTPRVPSERRGKQVLNQCGNDVSEAFYHGAAQVLKIAKLYQCEYAILKERSPSCGSQFIYDGTFSGKTVPGKGVTTQLLEQYGIHVMGEDRIGIFNQQSI